MKLSLRGITARAPSAAASVRAALQDVSLEIASGEQVAIIGPSGAGKTTLLLVAACALRPAAGELTLGERQPWKLSTRELQKLRGQLFLAPQVPPLPPRQRVVTAVLAGRLPSIGLWQSLRSLFYPVHLDEADAALARFDVQDKLFSRVDRLSGGERQRVGLARALLSQARLLLVDEPLSALDPTRASQAVATLAQAAREHGSTMLVSLHDVPVALANFPRIVGLRDGRIVFDCASADVTPAMLEDLYAQEQRDATTALPSEPASAAPVAMLCR